MPERIKLYGHTSLEGGFTRWTLHPSISKPDSTQVTIFTTAQIKHGLESTSAKEMFPPPTRRRLKQLLNQN